MKKCRALALLSSVMLCFVMFFSVAFVIAEFDHDCTGETCHICTEIEACVSLLNHLGLGLTGCAVIFGIFYMATVRVYQPADIRNKMTPISLKVKLTI